MGDWHREILLAASRFESAVRTPRDAQTEVLQRLLAIGRASAFGRQHHFGSVTSIDDYRAAVPIQPFEAFIPFIERAVGGEPDVLFRGVPAFIGKTSGSTGSPKMVCYHPDNARSMWNHVAPWLAQFPRHELERGYLFTGRYHEESTDAGVVVGSATGWVRQSMHSVPCFHRLPEAICELPSYPDRYLGMLWALIPRPLELLGAANPSTLPALLAQAVVHREALIHAYSTGGVPGPGLEGIAAAHPELRAKNPELAARLAAWPTSPRLIDLWPTLARIASWQDGSTSLYLDELQEQAPGVELVRLPSGATEGLVLTRGRARNTGCLPALLSTFLEFTEADDDAGTDTRLVDELEPGNLVRLIVSNDRGLYRLRTDDLYQVVAQQDQVPRLKYVGRSSMMSSLTGEKLTEAQATEAVRSAVRSVDAVVVAQLAPEWGKPPRYLLVLEVSEPDRLGDVQLEALCLRLEASLRELNEEYAYKRDTLRLGQPALVLLQPGEFHRRRQQQLGSSVRSDVQIKTLALSTALFERSAYAIARSWP